MSHLEKHPAKKSKSQRWQRRAVLSEEDFTTTLETIVQRDYYPEIPALQRQAAVLEKRALGDFPGAVAVRRAARNLQNHEEALAEQEAEDEHDLEAIGGSQLRKVPRPLHRETVTGFHARVTSEDNCEFDQSQRKEIQGNRKRLEEAFQSSNVALRITAGESSDIRSESPLLASDNFNAPLHRIEASQWKDSSLERNGLFFVPQRGDVAALEKQETKPLFTNTSSISVDESSAAALMPPPAPVPIYRDAPTTLSSNLVEGIDTDSAAVPKRHLVEYIPKYSTAKFIEPSQTRFTANPNMLALSNPRGHSLEGDEPSTTEYSTDTTTATTDLDASPILSLSHERNARAKRQRREHETLVAMTPLLVPGKSTISGSNDSAKANASPIVTWGTVASTPLVLGGVDTANEKTYSLPKESHREQAARQAEAKIEQAKHRMSSKRKKRQTATPVAVEKRIASLTPAARSLLEKNSGSRPSSAGVRSRGAFASALRSSYTPQVASRGCVKFNSINRDHALKATPRNRRRDRSSCGSVATVEPVSVGTRGTNITDGLLKLPGK